MEHLRQRNWNEAERCGREALALDPANAQAAIDLAQALGALGRDPEAVTVCERALEHSDLGRLHAEHAMALLRLNQSDAALAAGQRAFDLLTDDAAEVLTLSHLLAEVGLNDLADAAAHRAVVLSPASCDALTWLGLRLLASDPALAERRLRQSLQLDPAQPSAHFELAKLLHHRGLREEAAVALKAALHFAPGFTEARAWLLVVLQPVRRYPLLRTLGLFLLLASAWVALDSGAWSPGGLRWPRLVASAVLGLTGGGLLHLLDSRGRRELRQRDPELHSMLVAARTGEPAPRSAAGVLRWSGWMIGAFGLLVLVCAVVGEVWLTRRWLATGASNELVGMGVMAGFALGGGTLSYVGRTLLASSRRAAADRG